MRLSINGSGTEALRMQIDDLRTQLPSLVQDTMQSIGESLVTELSQASPRSASSGGTALAGDADGPLADSFETQPESASGDPGAAISVITTQPTKLGFVTQGRGEVNPVNKQALMWQGLAHPIRHAGPAQANDFVTPVLDGFDPQLTALEDEVQSILEGA